MEQKIKEAAKGLPEGVLPHEKGLGVQETPKGKRDKKTGDQCQSHKWLGC